MNVLTTLEQRGLNPVNTLEQALRLYIKTGQRFILATIATAKRQGVSRIAYALVLKELGARCPKVNRP